MSVKHDAIPFNKANFFVLKQERHMSKITIDFLSNENQKLKSQIEDMKITVRHNKEQLEEYVTQITNSDKVFDKMKNQIEQLTTRLKLLDKKQRKSQIQSQPANIPPEQSDKKTIVNIASTNATTFLKNTTSIIIKEDKKNLKNNKRNEDKFKEFFVKQSEIIEEMNILKDDIQFLLENKSKQRLKEKLDYSMSSNRSSNSNISYIGKSNDSISLLNSSMASNNTIQKKVNLKDRFDFIDKIGDFLFDTNSKKHILFMIDNKGRIWELIKRQDLSLNTIKAHPTYIKSILHNDTTIINNNNNNNNSLIDSRDYDNKSLKQNELELSKSSDFNLSRIIKESDVN